MKQVVAKQGWPTRSQVGLDGTRAAWLLVQHADLDVVFQRKCLGLMEAYKSSDQINQADLAYLTDRVLVNEGKPQFYGTQFHVVDGERRPRPIRGAEALDQRRKAMGMSTMKEYTELMNT